MNRERWQHLQLLIEQALAQPESSRRAFVQSACTDDIALRDEALSLLAAIEESPDTEEMPSEWLSLVTSQKPLSFAAGEQLAHRYQVRQLLGRGGMGEVYEAWDVELAIPIALKTLHTSFVSDEALHRLKVEGLLARSVWHPNICRVYDLGQHLDGERKLWFLTMELLRGETLSEHLREKGRIPLDRALKLAEQLAAGLGAAHRAGVVHRDFKPSNVMLLKKDDGEQGVITDFGTARAAMPRPLAEEAEQNAGVIIGTPAYMAPEQLLGEETGPAADIYSLGVVLYQMVTGTLPFAGSAIEGAKRRLVDNAPSPRHVMPELDENWAAVILRCLERKPQRRFGRAEEVAEALAGRGLPEAVIAPAATTRARHHLPAERDQFVGREKDLEEIDHSLTGDSRHVTLLGAGGMGKTRLAIHYGSRSLDAWPGGVWFCDLTEARGPNGIASAVARSLGVQLGRADPIKQLGHAIAGRGRCLLILDNFEQVVAHAEETLGRWLAMQGEARFLVTSRERLKVQGEKAHAVEPLSLELGLHLLVERARGLRPGFRLDDSDAESAREVIRLVDGMPLAIELAAARMRMMSAAQILAQMRKRFQLLTGGISARHETLQLMIDGSWEMLRPWEQSAWAQCAVFEGGFTLDAAEAVIDLRSWPKAPWVVDVLQSLVDKSLLRTWVSGTALGEETPQARFGMYATLQDYARIKLDGDSFVAEGGGSSAKLAAERHARWYAQYGSEEASDALHKLGGVKLRRRLELEIANLIAACRRAIEQGHGEVAVAAYRASWAVLELRGPFGTGIDLGREVLQGLHLGRLEEAYVDKALGQAAWYSGLFEDARIHLEGALVIARDLGDRSLEAKVMSNLGGMCYSQGNLNDARTFMDQALAAALDVGDRQSEIKTLNTLSMIGRGQGRIEEAGAYAERALEVALMTGDRHMEGTVRSNLGLLKHDRGRPDEARAHYEAALAIHREVGHRRFEGNVHCNLGNLHHDQGRMEEARTHMEAALAIQREVGDRFAEGIALSNLGSVYLGLGRPDGARTHFEAALAIMREIGNRRLEGNVIGTLGMLYHDQGELETARTHYEAALAVHREVGDQRSEGSILTYMARLLHHQGSVEAAWKALGRAEPLLRQVEDSLELGKLHCVRAELEHGRGDSETARHALSAAETLAERSQSGPDSDLGRMIARVRRVLSPVAASRLAPGRDGAG